MIGFQPSPFQLPKESGGDVVNELNRDPATSSCNAQVPNQVLVVRRFLHLCSCQHHQQVRIEAQIGRWAGYLVKGPPHHWACRASIVEWRINVRIEVYSTSIFCWHTLQSFVVIGCVSFVDSIKSINRIFFFRKVSSGELSMASHKQHVEF